MLKGYTRGLFRMYWPRFKKDVSHSNSLLQTANLLLSLVPPSYFSNVWVERHLSLSFTQTLRKMKQAVRKVQVGGYFTSYLILNFAYRGVSCEIIEVNIIGKGIYMDVNAVIRFLKCPFFFSEEFEQCVIVYYKSFGRY